MWVGREGGARALEGGGGVEDADKMDEVVLGPASAM